MPVEPLKHPPPPPPPRHAQGRVEGGELTEPGAVVVIGGKEHLSFPVIPGRSRSERTRNLDIV